MIAPSSRSFVPAPRPGIADRLPGGYPGLRAFQLAPPYHHERDLPGVPVAPLPPGSVLGLDAAPLPADWGVLERAVRLLRDRFPTVPVVLRVTPEVDELLRLTLRGPQLPVRAVLLRGQPVAPALRRQLTDPAKLPDDVVAWLKQLGLRMSPALTDLIRDIFARAPKHHEISSLCREIGAVESSARFRCSKKRLPSPSRWLQAARALHAILRLQAQPERALLPLALELGYADHSALSHQIRRTFGVRPGEVRGLLGWEWLMERWLRERRTSGTPALLLG